MHEGTLLQRGKKNSHAMFSLIDCYEIYFVIYLLHDFHHEHFDYFMKLLPISTMMICVWKAPGEPNQQSNFVNYNLLNHQFDHNVMYT